VIDSSSATFPFFSSYLKLYFSLLNSLDVVRVKYRKEKDAEQESITNRILNRQINKNDFASGLFQSFICKKDNLT